MNLLGIDFEDWYHPELVKKYVKMKNTNQECSKELIKFLTFLEKMIH